jgi:uncharacterized protein (TIGR01777 family)
VSTVLLSGASGFIGSQLVKSLAADGHQVVRLARRESKSSPATASVSWDPEKGQIDYEALARIAGGPEVVINLAGEPIAQRWTTQRRRRIRDSRVNGTRVLADAISRLSFKPRVFVSGSAIGYYGAQRNDEILDENSASGSDFLAQTARDWERATESAAKAGVRVVTPRTGVVLGRDGGALKRMLLPFQLGIGGRIGSGRQWMSWIALDDVVRALRFVVEAPNINGPVNLVAPEPVRNVDFAKVLGRVLGRPALVPLPSIALQVMFGSMAQNTILASQRVIPKRLAGTGFEFQHPRLEEALHFELRR